MNMKLALRELVNDKFLTCMEILFAYTAKTWNCFFAFRALARNGCSSRPSKNVKLMILFSKDVKFVIVFRDVMILLFPPKIDVANKNQL